MMGMMEYFNPTHIYVQEEGLASIGDIVASYGFKRVMLLSGGSSLSASGRLEVIAKSLKRRAIEFISSGGVQANPDLAEVQEALTIARGFEPELILAAGGGSVIDAAKSLANAYFYDGDPLDFNRHLAQPKKALPLGVVLTIAASGSEMSSSCVISDRTCGFKAGFNSLTNYPLFALLDPTLTYTVSPFQTACGLVDIISHSFERYFCPSQRFEVADLLALGVIRSIVDLTSTVLASPTNFEARRGMMLAGSLSHSGITSFSKPYSMPCHLVEHLISGAHPEIAHGLGLSFLLGGFLKINRASLADKIAEFGHFVFEVEGIDNTISAFDHYLKSLPLPLTMGECGIGKEEEQNYLAQLRLK